MRVDLRTLVRYTNSLGPCFIDPGSCNCAEMRMTTCFMHQKFDYEAYRLAASAGAKFYNFCEAHKAMGFPEGPLARRWARTLIEIRRGKECQL